MRPRRLFACALAALALAGTARAAERPVDIELVLAVDASRSIDGVEWDLQRQGYVAALTDPAVLQAIRSGAIGAVALSYVEWSGPVDQEVVIGWQIVSDEETAAEFAKALAAEGRRFRSSTSISGAIDFAAKLFDGNGIEGTRRVIDISGDGVNNRGRPSDAARDDAVAAGITINALAIINDRPSRFRYAEQRLDDFMRDHVIGGPGAFLIVVQDFESFGEAIKKKLLHEIAGRVLPARGGSLASRLSPGD
jgi:hypothetical protein